MSASLPNRDTIRAHRIDKLAEWGRTNLDEEALKDETKALRLLSSKVIELFEVSSYTARDYSRVALWRLKKEKGIAD